LLGYSLGNLFCRKDKTKFSRVYGIALLVFYLPISLNIAMVIGIFPTIGVPLPFFSYGGSGLWGFTIYYLYS
jgi:rod shape determining protein RodA